MFFRFKQGCHTLRELRETQGIFKLKKTSRKLRETQGILIYFLNSGKLRFFIKNSGKFLNFKNLSKFFARLRIDVNDLVQYFVQEI